MNEKKKILLIMPRFYTYTETIVEEIKKQGLQVILMYEEPPQIILLALKKIQGLFNTDFLYRVYNYALLRKVIKKKIKYDYLLVIRGNILNSKFIESIKHAVLRENARSVYYTWDSLDFVQHNGKIADLFDEKYSFDSVDVISYPGWKLLPLFFTNEYNRLCEKANHKAYDLCCICSLNKYRYNMVYNLKLQNPKLNIYRKFYIGKTLFAFKKLTDPYFREIDVNDLIFTPMKDSEIIQVYSKSKAVLDVTYSNQNGLSMRTIESVGIKKKITTNNAKIRNYDFYTDNNVYVYDETDMHIPDEWLDSEFIIDEDIRIKYSIKRWIETLLNKF